MQNSKRLREQKNLSDSFFRESRGQPAIQKTIHLKRTEEPGAAESHAKAGSGKHWRSDLKIRQALLGG